MSNEYEQAFNGIVECLGELRSVVNNITRSPVFQGQIKTVEERIVNLKIFLSAAISSEEATGKGDRVVAGKKSEMAELLDRVTSLRRYAA